MSTSRHTHLEGEPRTYYILRGTYIIYIPSHLFSSPYFFSSFPLLTQIWVQTLTLSLNCIFFVPIKIMADQPLGQRGLPQSLAI